MTSVITVLDVGKLTIKVDIQYRPGRQNSDADALSRFPILYDFTGYVSNEVVRACLGSSGNVALRAGLGSLDNVASCNVLGVVDEMKCDYSHFFYLLRPI